MPSYEKEGGKREKMCTHTLLDLYIDDLIESVGHFEVDILIPVLEKEAEVNGLVCGGAAQVAQPSLEPSMAWLQSLRSNATTSAHPTPPAGLLPVSLEALDFL